MIETKKVKMNAKTDYKKYKQLQHTRGWRDDPKTEEEDLSQRNKLEVVWLTPKKKRARAWETW